MPNATSCSWFPVDPSPLLVPLTRPRGWSIDAIRPFNRELFTLLLINILSPGASQWKRLVHY